MLSEVFDQSKLTLAALVHRPTPLQLLAVWDGTEIEVLKSGRDTVWAPFVPRVSRS